MGGTINYVYWKGARLTPWMLYQLRRLDADLYRDWGLHLNVESGIRLHEEQREIFFDRYTTNPNGRYVYLLNGRPDRRWYLGNWWYRIKDGGTVAVPGGSNHEIQGQNAAVDISDDGDANGITKKNSARGRWLRSRLHLYDMDAEGDSFGEGWHVRVHGIFRTPPATPAGNETSKPLPAPVPELPEGKNMADVKQMHWMNGDKVGGRAIYIPGTAWAVPFTESGSTYANGFAESLNTGDSLPVTKSLFDAVLRAGERCAPRGDMRIEIVNADG